MEHHADGAGGNLVTASSNTRLLAFIDGVEAELVAAADRAVEAAVALKLAELRATAAEEAAATNRRRATAAERRATAAERRVVEVEDSRDQLCQAVEDVKYYRELEDEDLLRRAERELECYMELLEAELEEDEDYGD